MVEQASQSVVRIEAGGGSGSGFIYKTGVNGIAYVMTNYHVIDGSWNVSVWVNDSRQYPGKVQGYDGKKDLAVVEICCGAFRALEFANSHTLRAGQEVIAIGYPLDLVASATVTRGIVSAKNYDSYWSSYVIQTDAPINPGNSGGPLLSMNGQVIGVNTASYDWSESGRPVEGIGIAVASQSIQQVVAQLQIGSRTGVPTPTPTVTPRPTLTPTPMPAQGQWRTYYNQQYRYSIQVPPYWGIDDSNPASVVFFDGPKYYAQIKVFKPGWRMTSPLTELQDYVFEIERESIWFEIVRWNSTKFPEGETFEVWFRRQQSTEYCQSNDYQVLIVPNNGMSSTWLITTVCQQYSNRLFPDMLQMLGSVNHW